MSVDEAIPNGSRITRESFNSSDNVPKKKISKESVKAEILSFLRNNQIATYQEISAAVGVVRSTAEKYVKELVETGLPKREGNIGKSFDILSNTNACVRIHI